MDYLIGDLLKRAGRNKTRENIELNNIELNNIELNNIGAAENENDF